LEHTKKVDRSRSGCDAMAALILGEVDKREEA
jgi:hypothetical protein